MFFLPSGSLSLLDSLQELEVFSSLPKGKNADTLDELFMKRLTLSLILLILLVCATPDLFSHPHMFLDTELVVWDSPEGMEGFTVVWHFDKVFTASIKMDYDRNKDGVFNKEETQAIYNNAFINLKHYNYFTYIMWEGDTYIPSSVENFKVRLEEGRLVYEFFVPFQVRPQGSPINLRIAVYDKSFFCDVAYAEERPVKIAGAEAFDLSYAIQRNKDLTIEYDNTVIGSEREGTEYTGIAHPLEMKISLTKK